MSTFECEYIDYEELIEDLKADLAGGTVNEDTPLLVVRSIEKAKILGKDKLFEPVLDYFYDTSLPRQMQEMTVLEAKKLCFDAMDSAKRASAESAKNDEVNAQAELVISAAELLIDVLSDYTAGNPKRKDRKCYVILTNAESGVISSPLMIYFCDDNVSTNLEELTLGELLEELTECNRH